jgi:hypothetical protein
VRLLRQAVEGKPQDKDAWATFAYGILTAGQHRQSPTFNVGCVQHAHSAACFPSVTRLCRPQAVPCQQTDRM